MEMNNSHENQETSILMIKKARTRLKFLQLSQRKLPDKDYRTGKKNRKGTKLERKKRKMSFLHNF
jgi:hypothetical protein